jgi:heparanase 1
MLWYGDAMASKAVAGYAAFCRQDFIGADYGLVNFTSLAPSPDYWLLVLWKQLIGTRVIAVSSPPPNPLVRTYGFCGTKPGTVALLIVHLGSTSTCLEAPGLAKPGSQRTEYSLTPSDGTVTAVGVGLNGGVPLAFGPGGALPSLDGVPVPAANPINLAPLSVTFVTLESMADACLGQA